jgi:sialic acid synthase SpsE
MSVAQKITQYRQEAPLDLSPTVIAEAGVNHEGQMDLAKRLIDEAQEAGAHAIKFQTYKAHTIASKHSPAYWDLTKEPTTSQFELFQKYDSFWKAEFEELKTYCDRQNIEFMSTPFDTESAHFLNDLMTTFKISSSDITNKPFIEYIAKFGKPILLSTGASSLEEIREAIGWIENYQLPYSLMHCVLSYPTSDENANLGMIKDLKDQFPAIAIGYSDHTLPGDMRNLETATLLGACILEKHFTHNKTLPGNDHYHAMDRKDLKVFFKNLTRLTSVIGSTQKQPIEAEMPARSHARRSIVANKEIPEGKLIEASDLTFKRPAHGISPRHWNDVIGKQAIQTISEDSALQWSDLQQTAV